MDTPEADGFTACERFFASYAFGWCEGQGPEAARTQITTDPRSLNRFPVDRPAGEAQGAANVFYAIGQHNAFGFSPFEIDAAEDTELARSYDLPSQLAPLILENQPKWRVA